jgi:uncharacterized damage-inducible protein DinB
MSDRVDDFLTFAAYNAWANARLYDAVAELPGEAITANRPAAFFRSIVGTLNHVLVADRIWMDRFEHLPPADLALNAIVHAKLSELRAAREAEDARIRRFVGELNPADLERKVAYKNSKGDAFADPLHRLLTHLFNHQTHHRGQAHALVKEAGMAPPPLDYVYYMREVG